MEIRENQWDNKRTFVEKFLLDTLLPRNNKLLFSSIEKGWKARTQNSSVELDPLKPPRLSIISVGNSHLDTAWLWRKSDAREKKIYPTFSRAIYHIDKYPEFTFTANAMIHYEWIRDDFPTLFQEIKQSVQDGRWELVGGDWVEMDVNIPNGESLIRQRLIGQRFLIREFHSIADIAWFDDVFGFCPNLPQILKKSGAKYFFTNKFCYNDYSYKFAEDSPKYVGGEKFPLFHFIWKAPDDSEVMVTWAQHKNNFWKHLKHFTKHSRVVKPEEKNHFDYSMTWQDMNNKLSDEVIPLLVNAYGHGDGGMGPRPLEILEQFVWNKKQHIQLGTMKYFFKQLEPYRNRLPIWQDELYLENHQGTLTSVSMIKENNHTAEVLINQAEILSAFAGMSGKDHFQEEFVDDWKTLLFLQFHDVLPGSSIVEVYRDAAADYNLIFHHIASCIESAIMSLAESVKEKDVFNTISVFNALSWNRSGNLLLSVKTYTGAFNASKQPLIVQRVGFSHYIANRELQIGLIDATGTDYLKDLDGDQKLIEYESKPQDLMLIHFPSSQPILAFGLSPITLLEGSSSSGAAKSSAGSIQELADVYLLENSKLMLKISKQSGNIIDLMSKNSPMQSFGSILNADGIGFCLYTDEKTKFDAWNLDPEYRSKPIETLVPIEFIIEEQGPIRWTLMIKYQYTMAKSVIHTRISLYLDDPKLYGESLISWNEDHKLLKLKVSTKFNSENISVGTPYYIHQRSTKPRSVWQEGMLEHAYQQFAYWMHKDNQHELGVAFYTQSKYGMFAKDGTAEFSFLKAPNFEKHDPKYATLDPDFPHSPIVDRCFHRIPWAIEILSAIAPKLDALHHGYEFNVPLIAFPANIQHPPQSFLSIDVPNVIVSSIKEMETFMPDAPDWFYKPGLNEFPLIVRCVEMVGYKTNCHLHLSKTFKIKKVLDVDLLERISDGSYEPKCLSFENSSIPFEMKPYEIKSFLILIEKHEQK